MKTHCRFDNERPTAHKVANQEGVGYLDAAVMLNAWENAGRIEKPKKEQE